MPIPLQENANMADPEEHVLWALVNIGGDIGAPLLLPEEIMRHWSKHLFECGFRHVPEEQRRWYEPPGDDSSLWHGAGGKWVSEKPKDKADAVDDLVGALSPAMRAKLLARLESEDKGVDDGGIS